MNRIEKARRESFEQIKRARRHVPIHYETYWQNGSKAATTHKKTAEAG
jgi:hypothetical protein